MNGLFGTRKSGMLSSMLMMAGLTGLAEITAQQISERNRIVSDCRNMRSGFTNSIEVKKKRNRKRSAIAKLSRRRNRK